MRLYCYYNFQPGGDEPVGSDIEEIIKRDWTNPFNYIDDDKLCKFHGTAKTKIGRLEVFITNTQPSAELGGDLSGEYNQNFYMDLVKQQEGEISPIFADLHCYSRFSSKPTIHLKDENLAAGVPNCVRNHWCRPAEKMERGDSFELTGFANMGFAYLSLHIGTDPLTYPQKNYDKSFIISKDNQIKNESNLI